MFKAEEAEYVIFDFETTGLSPVDGDRIIEIGALRLKKGKFQDRFTTFVNPERPVAAQNIHHISDDMVAGAPTAVEVLPKFLDFVGGAVLVAHNASFDVRFLSYQLALMGRRLRPETPAVDTMKMSKSFLPHLGRHRLGSLGQSLGLPIGEAHRAMADVELLAEVFKRLLMMASDHNMYRLTEIIEAFSVEKPSFKISARAETSLF